ncbi:Methionine--tRNA ligase, partial [Clarias magur]
DGHASGVKSNTITCKQDECDRGCGSDFQDSGWLPDVLNACGITALWLDRQKHHTRLIPVLDHWSSSAWLQQDRKLSCLQRVALVTMVQRLMPDISSSTRQGSK